MRHLPSFLCRFGRDRRGHVAVTFGLVFVPSIMFIGGSIDLGMAYKAQQKLQAAADAGVLAAASMPSSTPPEAREAMALNIFNANAQGIGETQPSLSVNGNSVAIDATATVPTAFLAIANIRSLTVRGASGGAASYSSSTTTTTTTTTRSNGGAACLLALDPSAPTGMISQGTPRIDYTGCRAHTNSTMAGAISGGGSAIVVGDGHTAVGGVEASALSVYTPAPVGGRPVTPDPFATVSAYTLPNTSYRSTFTAPAIPQSCAASSLNLKQGSFELSPGRYCGGINMQSGARVRFLPGVYIIDNGELNIQSGSTVVGDDVLFYFVNPNARFSVIGGGTGSVNLKGRKTGSTDLQGFLFIAHPNAWRGLTSNIQGGSSFTMEGMVYAPTQNVLITGNGDSNAASNMFAVIAKSFEFRGNGIFRFKPWNPASGMPNILPEVVTTTTTTTSSTQETTESVRLQ
jgi:Flp pilus assembly protein TadG